MTTEFAQGAARLTTHTGAAPQGVRSPDNTYQPLQIDSEGRLLAADHAALVHATSDRAAPAANNAATVTYAAPGLGLAHAFDGFVYSATGTIAAAVELVVTDAGATVWGVIVGATGVQQVALPLRATENAALAVSLPALGASGTGRVNVVGHRVIVVTPSARNGLLDFRQPDTSEYLIFF